MLSINSKPNVSQIRKDFPLLEQAFDGQPIVYLDNAATTQKPLAVIQAVEQFYMHSNANVHRGEHLLSDRATEAFEASRDQLRLFINASKREEIIWTKGTTESINLVAQSYAGSVLQEGDEVVISAMEHHANIVPWQQVCEQRSAVLKVIPVTEKGELNFAAYKDMLSDRVKIVAVGHVSNALGSVNPVKDIIFEAHRVGAKVLIDGAQSVPHFDIDVQDLNCDFYAFSGHKLFGPTGIGVLFGKEALLEAMPPYQVGGEMIDKVSFEKTTFNRLPYKFEAGTPHISGAVGLSAAISYLNLMDRQSLLAHENALLQLATKKMLSIEGIKLVGTAEQKAGVLSFMLEGVHPHDVGTLLDKQGVAVRTGHHCAMPIMQQFGIPGTIRASFSFYNNESDVDQLIEAVQKAKRFLL